MKLMEVLILGPFFYGRVCGWVDVWCRCDWCLAVKYEIDDDDVGGFFLFFKSEFS